MRCEKSREIDLAAFSAEREDARFADFRAHYPTCRDCAREVERWSKLERMLRVQAPLSGGPHPEEAELLAYARQPGSLQQARRSAVSLHLEACASCRSEEAVLRGFDLAAVAAADTERVWLPAWERLRGAVRTVADALFGWVPEPLWVPLMLVLLLVPAALLIWDDDPERQGAVSQLAEQAPEPAFTPLDDRVEVLREQGTVAPPEARVPRESPSGSARLIAQTPQVPDLARQFRVSTVHAGASVAFLSAHLGRLRRRWLA